MEKYRFARKYAEAWYNKYIISGTLKNKYNLTSEIPTLDEWIKNDAKQQDNPKTEFGKELKNVYRAKYGGNKSLIEERNEFVTEFYESITDTDITYLKEDITPLLQQSLAQKDIWLQIAGDVHSEKFYFEWSPMLIVSEIKNINIIKRKDIELQIECDNNFSFKGILRWGKGAGFSNLRLDLK
jgi:hypothetical protein